MLPIMQNAGSAIQAASRGLVGNTRTSTQAQTGVEETPRPIDQPRPDDGTGHDRNRQEALNRSTAQGGSRGMMLDATVGRDAASVMTHKNEIEANVTVIRKTDDMIGSLLDVMA